MMKEMRGSFTAKPVSPEGVRGVISGALPRPASTRLQAAKVRSVRAAESRSQSLYPRAEGKLQCER
jgi:hypothetical protein